MLCGRTRVRAGDWPRSALLRLDRVGCLCLRLPQGNNISGTATLPRDLSPCACTSTPTPVVQAVLTRPRLCLTRHLDGCGLAKNGRDRDVQAPRARGLEHPCKGDALVVGRRGAARRCAQGEPPAIPRAAITEL